MSIIEAVELDLAILTNDFYYRKLLEPIEKSYVDKKPQFED